MKRGFALLLIAVGLIGCGEVKNFITPGATPTPAPSPASTAAANAAGKASPTPGNWMWKDYKNPLDQNQKKSPGQSRP